MTKSLENENDDDNDSDRLRLVHPLMPQISLIRITNICNKSETIKNKHMSKSRMQQKRTIKEKTYVKESGAGGREEGGDN